MSIRLFAALLALAFPGLASSAWQLVATEQGKRVEIDRDSIVSKPNGEYLARGRIVLDRPIVDPRTSASYRIIEVENRFDCTERTYATLKRSYFLEEGELLRLEEVRNPYDTLVRSGTPDDRLLREVCRPKPVGAAAIEASKTAEKVSEAAGELRKLNDALVENEVQKSLKKIRLSGPVSSSRNTSVSSASKVHAASPPASVAWAYAGAGGPEYWSALKSDYAICSSGQRQSPIDLREGIAVDLEPIQFAYQPATFRVVDSGRNLQVAVYGGSLGLLGKNYALIRIHFHRPSEMKVEGKSFDMDVQLVHRTEDGKLAIVSILFEKGVENPVVQMVLNNLPLEKGGEVVPPSLSLDMERLLPEKRDYYTFMGSLSSPPCTEDVLWMVLKQPQQISPEQLAIFQRLYPPNARPVQPRFGRIIKESR